MMTRSMMRAVNNAEGQREGRRGRADDAKGDDLDDAKMVWMGMSGSFIKLTFRLTYPTNLLTPSYVGLLRIE
jgi:hypothetical protein